MTPCGGGAAINRSRTLQVNLRNPSTPYMNPIAANAAFQELGLLPTPTPFTFNSSTTPDIEFTLHVLEASNGPSQLTATPGTVAGSLATSTKYFFVVTSFNGSSESSPSPEASAMTDGTHGAINLTWRSVNRD